MCIERRRAVLVGLNKADLLSKADKASAETQARDALAFARFAPIVLLSAKSGAGVSELMRSVAQAADQFTRRIPTAELNRFFSDVLERNPPPTHLGRAPRLYYITQAEASPPLFVAMCNAPESIKPSYKRFVQNQIHKAFGFGAVPVTVFYKRRPRRELSRR
jgi:GTP-binding protein